MKIKYFSVAFAIVFCLLVQQSVSQNTDLPDSQVYFEKTIQRPKLKDYSREIEALLKKMTIEEKVGQMTQLEIGQITSGGDSNIEIDKEKLKKAIIDYKVGSILNVNGHALPVDKWHKFIGV